MVYDMLHFCDWNHLYLCFHDFVFKNKAKQLSCWSIKSSSSMLTFVTNCMSQLNHSTPAATASATPAYGIEEMWREKERELFHFPCVAARGLQRHVSWIKPIALAHKPVSPTERSGCLETPIDESLSEWPPVCCSVSFVTVNKVQSALHRPMRIVACNEKWKICHRVIDWTPCPYCF